MISSTGVLGSFVEDCTFFFSCCHLTDFPSFKCVVYMNKQKNVTVGRKYLKLKFHMETPNTVLNHPQWLAVTSIITEHTEPLSECMCWEDTMWSRKELATVTDFTSVVSEIPTLQPIYLWMYFYGDNSLILWFINPNTYFSYIHQINTYSGYGV